MFIEIHLNYSLKIEELIIFNLFNKGILSVNEVKLKKFKLNPLLIIIKLMKDLKEYKGFYNCLNR